MNKTQLMDRFRAERARLESTLQDLNELQMTQRGAYGPWSAKDVLAHITYWEQQMIAEVRRGLRGGLIRWMNDAVETDRLNAQVYEVSRRHSLAEVLADFRRSQGDVIRLVQSLDEADLADPRLYAWADDGESCTLAQFITAETIEHYNEHIGSLCAWRERHKAALRPA